MIEHRDDVTLIVKRCGRYLRTFLLLFSRTSLRNSKRLKALEKSSRMAQPPGFYNDAFEDEQFTQNEPSSIVGIPSGIEMFDGMIMTFTLLFFLDYSGG